MNKTPNRVVTATRLVCAILAAAALSACGTILPTPTPRVYEQESFDNRRSFSREFVASPNDTCNAARRALLSQGYVVSQAVNDTQIEARKRFQPESEQHVMIEFAVVCSPIARGQPTSVAFVSATQERFQVKKNPMSASVGLSPLGSISLPLASATDQLVRTGSETIPPGRFYDRFFDLVEQFLAEQMGLEESAGAPSAAPIPAAAPPAPERQMSPSGSQIIQRAHNG
ncbi:MAG TPA: DUF2242 domain-containing protein [Burkholderiaceae bacterium]|nr:DUF2242 domain-containing protein [Burkholderiaceae bacterium]